MTPIHLFIVICGVWGLRFGSADGNQIVCPKYCNCDLFENLNRADCSDKKLISTSIEIPPTVEILDLSYNDISSLEDKCFKDLKYLINLTLSNNGIHTIFLDAFYDLVNLQNVDLSYNRLEYFDPRIFENNEKLVSVNLDGNKFMSLSNGPLIISPSIQYLSLHKSQIMQISEQQFAQMPILSDLDLSDNFMITLDAEPFTGLNHLTSLNILNNRWTTCHSELKNTVEYLRGRQIKVRINVCNSKFAGGGKKFERMMMAPADDNKTAATTAPSVEKDVSAIWKNSSELNRTDIFQCDVEDIETICTLYESCTLKYNKLVSDQLINKYRMKFINNNERIYVAFYSGIFSGFFITSCVVYVIYLICGSRYWKKRRLQRSHAERRRQPSACRSTRRQPTMIPRPARPIRSARQTTSSHLHPSRHAASRANQREFLLTRLFERPERHRYNHNHLPNNGRLLSGNAQNVDTEQLIRPSPADRSIASPIAIAVENPLEVQPHVEHNQQEEDFNDDLLDLEAVTVITPADDDTPPALDSLESLRSETPPPPYSEIVRD